LNSTSIDTISEHSESLFESYRTELYKGRIPEGMDWHSLMSWEQAINQNGLTIKSRLAAIEYGDSESLLFSRRWKESLEHIMKIYGQSRPPDNSFPDQPMTNLLLPFITHVRSLLKPVFELSKAFVLPELLDDILNQLAERLTRISSFCIGAHYQAYCNSKTNDRPSKNLFVAYSSFFYESGVHEFFGQYPVLARLLSIQCLIYSKAIQELFGALEADRAFLNQKGLLSPPPGRLKQISFEESIAFKPAGPALIIRFSEGDALHFKRKNPYPDLLYRDIINLVNQHSSTVRLMSPICAGTDAYSWHSPIEQKSCKSIADIEKYFYRLGYTAALLQMLNARDYHLGNIIAHGAYPVAVDNETLVYPFLSQAAIDFRNAGLLATDKSPQGNGIPQLLGAFQYSATVNLETASIDKQGRLIIASKPIVWEGRNRPLLNGNPVLASDFEVNIIEGYIQGLKELKTIGPAILERVKESIGAAHYRFRYIRRSSLHYLKMAYASLAPAYMASGIQRSLLFEKLFSNCNPTDKPTLQLTHIEAEWLYLLQWPRFEFSDKTWNTSADILLSQKAISLIQNSLTYISDESNISMLEDELRFCMQQLWQILPEES